MKQSIIEKIEYELIVRIYEDRILASSSNTALTIAELRKKKQRFDKSIISALNPSKNCYPEIQMDPRTFEKYRDKLSELPDITSGSKIADYLLHRIKHSLFPSLNTASIPREYYGLLSICLLFANNLIKSKAISSTWQEIQNSYKTEIDTVINLIYSNSIIDNLPPENILHFIYTSFIRRLFPQPLFEVLSILLDMHQQPEKYNYASFEYFMTMDLTRLSEIHFHTSEGLNQFLFCMLDLIKAGQFKDINEFKENINHIQEQYFSTNIWELTTDTCLTLYHNDICTVENTFFEKYNPLTLEQLDNLILSKGRPYGADSKE